MIRRLARRQAAFGLIIMAAVATTVTLVLAILTMPGRTALFVRWYLVVIGVLAIAGAIHAIMLRYPVDWRPPAEFAKPAPPPPLEWPPRLREIERLVAYSKWDAADYNARLQPVLRAIAAQRLAAQTIDLDADPDAARRALGDLVWTLLEPKDPIALRRDGGIDPDGLRMVVATLEALDDDPHG
ncbi:MAG TPA: hypothetical protein VFU81_02310 [Thermomicrobiales bacterium]|nr:hypothetical protein [Thermomicrobiales bacterium]